MARLTRKELKSDKFALEVEHTVSFFEEHRREVIRYGLIGLAVVAVGVAIWFWRQQVRDARQEALARAIQVQEAPVGNAPASIPVSFPTQQAKDQAALTAFAAVARDYSGSDEAAIAQYYLGCISADQGKLGDAEKHFDSVVKTGSKNYASLAKLSLSQIYFATNRAADGEKVLRDLMAHPTDFVSKDQATISLARALAPTNPAEARKLVDPLRLSRDADVSRVAFQLASELPPQ